MKRPTFITWDQLKVGALIIGSLSALGYATLKLGRSVHLFSDRYELVTLLPSAAGLLVGGSVSVAGQPAGTIKRIEFLPVDDDSTRNLLVALSVDERVHDQIRADSRVQVRTLGLLGDKTLDISPGSPAFSPLVEGDTLIALAVIDYDQFVSQAAGALDDFVSLTSDLRVVTSGLARGEGTLGMLLRDNRLYDELNVALRTANGLLARVNSSSGTFGKLVDDPTLYHEVVGAARTVDSVARRFTNERGTIGRLLSDSSVFISLQSATGRADSLLKGLGAGQGTLGKLLTDESLFEQLVGSIAELTAILEDFRKNPSRYTRGLIRIF